MGLDINRSTGRGTVVADRKLWLTAGKDRLVEDGDPDAAFLWATPGKKVSVDDARRLDYQPRSDAKAIDAPVEDKAVSETPNKARGRKTKGA